MSKNNLKLESSAYLLQHANNPIHWQRWNENLYKKYNNQEKLLLVSIGYSSCHWCHVMEKETFEDKEVANYMNNNFISIKVDREENPEIDNIYMTATQMMTGSGGWPLNVVCLPDGRPVYGGTYHTKEQWLEVIGKIQKVYKNDKKELYLFAEKIEKGIQEVNRFEFSKKNESYKAEMLEKEMILWSRQWDTVNGGELQNQKFITPVKFNYILQYQKLNQDNKISIYLEKTLKKIALSGIVDHLEGGFYRYTVDPEWRIPHFEKMLYDNAQLLTLYANAYKEFKNPLFESTVYSIFNFLIKRMENSKGGFYSAIDADNEDGEGRYYIFNSEEIKTIASDNLNLLLEYYQINLKKAFEDDFHHLRKTDNLNELLIKYDLTKGEFNKIRSKWENQFKTLKKNRDFPLTDNKIITSWNLQMVSGLLSAYEALGDESFLNQAKKTFNFIEYNLISKNFLMHTFQENMAKIKANLEDYAFAIKAALDLYKNTGNTDYLYRAENFTETVIENFKTINNPFFTFTEKPVLFSDIITVDDNVIPSANAIMAENLWLLGLILENKDYSKKSKKMLDSVTSYFSKGRGSNYSQWAQLLAKLAYTFKEVVIVGPNAKKVNKELQKHYLPNVIFQISEKESELSLLKDRYYKNETLIYVCENKVCLRPSKSIREALKQIKNH